MITEYTLHSPIYSPSNILEVLEMSVNDDMLVTSNSKEKRSSKVQFYNVPSSFDIETTSFYYNGEKTAIMYEWTFGINGNVIIGRTWDELEQMLKQIAQHLELSVNKRLLIYVHNLSFEFQFLRKRLLWEKVFSIEPRKPIYAITLSGLEFRCSYMLSGYSLEKLGDELQRYKVSKMTGDLDYTLLRHAKTPLTEAELKYCENDVRVVMSYIQECIENDGDISKIPLTKTGYVRNYCRSACLYSGSDHKKNTAKFKNYRSLMKTLTLEPDEYSQLKRAFQGGFTHANAYYTGEILQDVASYDFTSSYPYVMVSEKFPMSKGRLVHGTGRLNNEDEFYFYLKRYCCLFDVRFYGIMIKVPHETPISFSRCYSIQGAVSNNGRIVQADILGTTLTEQDFKVIRYFYTWERIEIANFRVYERGYLPTDFIKSVLKLYSDKTTLKGVAGKEVEYLLGKGMLNATYGMMVTDICRDDNLYSKFDDWEIEKPDIDKAIENYNKSVKRFLFYPWGVWVTAYARANLFTGIIEFGSDYVYSDTDSVKVLNHEKHLEYISQYNNMCTLKLKAACEFHKLPFSVVEPETIKGDKKLLGVWDFEGVYSRFKTLGAKRYLTELNGKISMTVSGVNKKFAVPYLLKMYGVDGIFEAFDNYLKIPPEYTGKNTHTYIDDERQGILVDYTGISLEFHELSGTHLEAADYSLSMTEAYLNYLKGLRTIER